MGKKYTTDELEVGGHMLDASMMGSLNTVVTNSSSYMTTLPSHSHDVLYHNSTNSIDISDHSGHTWLRNSGGRWTFQSGSSGDDWTQSFSHYLPAAGSSANAVWMELGQRKSNASDGRYKGVRIVKYSGSSIVDGDLQVGNIVASVDIKAPIFYDSNNTGYYVNPAGTSRLGYVHFDGYSDTSGNARTTTGVSLGRYTSEYAHIDIASSHGSGGWIDFSDVSGEDYRGRIRYHNGSDYMSFYAGGSNEEFRINSSYTTSLGSSRAPVFYDSNDTGYYVNPASTSNLNTLTMAGNLTVNGKVYLDSSGSGYYGGAIEIRETAKGGLLTGAWDDSPGISFHWGGRVVKRFGIRADGQFAVDDSPIALQSWVDGTFLRTTEKAADSNLLDGIDSGSFLRSDATDIFTNTIYNRGYLVSGENGHRNKGIFGVYDSTKTSPIWSMGTGYKNHVDGTNFGNLYGLAYKHTNNSTGGTMGGGHQMVWAIDGNARGSIGHNAMWHAESMKAPIFYDSNNTAYYINPASTSLMNRLELNNRIDMRAQTGAWIEANVMTDAIGWNTNYGVYIGSNVGGTHYLRGNGTFTTGGSTYNLYHTGNLTAADIGASAVGHVHSYLPLSGGTLSGNLDVNADIQANTYTQAAHGIPRNNLGAPTVTEMALFDNQFTPKTTLANDYDDLSDLTFWKQETSSSAWVEITTFSDDQKRRFLRTKNSNIAIPNGVYKFRVEFVGKGYTFANAMYAYWSGQSHNTQVHVWKYNVNSSSWIQHTSSSTKVSSWPGHLYLPFSTIPWLESATTHTGHYKSLRIEFTPTWSTGTYSDRTIALYGMEIWGGYPAGRREPHYYDQDGQLNIVKNLSVAGDLKAPVFYDSDDTSRFVNPTGDSTINGLIVQGLSEFYSNSHFEYNVNVAGTLDGYLANIDYLGIGTTPNTSGSYRINMGGSIDMNANSIDYVSQIHFNDNVRFYDDGNDSYLNFKYGDGGAGGIRIRDNGSAVKGTIYADTGSFGLLDNDGSWAVRTQTGTNPLELRCDNNTEFQVYNSYTSSPGSSRAPIFYDLDNTAYYLNPAGTSNLNAITSQGTSNFRTKRHNFGLSDNWDAVGFSQATNLHMNGHSQFWIGAGNGTWFTGAANTKSQASGLAADASKTHDLLITTMPGASTYDRGITFAVDDTGAGTSGWRLGKFHSGTDATDSMFAVDGQIRAKGGYTDEYDYYADDYSQYYDDGQSHWPGDTAAGWHKPSIVASSAIQIQSGNKTVNTRKPQIQFHQYGYGGIAIEYDGPNKKLQIGMIGGSSASRFNTFSLKFGTNEAFKVNTDYASHNSDMRAPVFYDYNDTGYYVDPAGYSNLLGLVIKSGDLRLHDNSTLSPELRFQNNTHHMGIDYQNNETLRFITRSGTTTVPITFQMRAGTITAANFILSSDERKKTKIVDLSCDNIDVSWKSFEMKDNEGEYRTGVIAQELEQKHPEFVNTNDEGFKSVKYIDLLIAKIAELEARLEKLEK